MNNKHDCSCNDSYEETKKLIGEASKNIRFCYAKGPTGPLDLKAKLVFKDYQEKLE